MHLKHVLLAEMVLATVSATNLCAQIAYSLQPNPANDTLSAIFIDSEW